MLRTRLIRDPHDEDGFSLVETVVALGLATTVLLGMLGAGLFSIRSAVTARQNQSAADVLNRVIEDARSLEYASITMRTSDLGSDPRLSPAGVTPRTFDPGTGAEPVDARDVGAIFPHLEQQVTPNATYSVARYVTLPPQAVMDVNGQPSVRRLSVVVSWTKNGTVRQKTTSTLLTRTRRGLPLPLYSLTYNGPATLVSEQPTIVKNPGNDVSYGMVLRNQGARDSWTFTASTTTAGWRFYADTDRDGLWSGDATEPELTAASTGILEPGSSPFYVVAHRVIGLTEFGSSTTVFTATSDAQPALPGKTVTTVLTVTTGVITQPSSSPAPTTAPTEPCDAGSAKSITSSGVQPFASRPTTAYTVTPLYLVNGPTVRDTPTESVSTMTAETGALQPDLCNWSTDQQTMAAGRLVVPGGVTPFGQVEWRYKARSNNGESFGGVATAVLHVQCVSSTSALTVSVLSVDAGVFTQRGRTAVTLPTSCNNGHFERIDIPVNLSTFSVGTDGDDFLALTVSSSGTVRLAHGVAGNPSRFVVAVK